MRCTYVPYAHQTSDWILAADPLLRHTGTSHIEYRRINDIVTFVQEGKKITASLSIKYTYTVSTSRFKTDNPSKRKKNILRKKTIPHR